MTDAWSFETTGGRAHVEGDQVRVDRGLAGLVRGTVDRQWRRASGLRRVVVLSALVTVPSTVGRLWARLADGVTLSGGDLFAAVVLAMFGLGFCRWLYSGLASTTVPLSAIERVVVDPHDDEVVLERADGETTVRVPDETALDDAAEAFELRGVTVEEAAAADDAGGAPSPAASKARATGGAPSPAETKSDDAGEAPSPAETDAVAERE